MSACAGQQKDTCEDDKIDGKWDKIVSNDECSAEERGEAYLALGGFNYFDFINNEEDNLISILGLNKDNWENKRGYFDAAAMQVASIYETGSGTSKSIFFFGSFLAMYTYMTGTLDNGKTSSTTAFDGNIESEEVEQFTGVGVESDSSGDDGTDLVATNDFQFKLNSKYYILDLSSDSLFYDLQADGKRDSEITDPDKTVILAQIASFTELNQIVYMDRLENPLSGTVSDGGDAVITFSETLVGYLDNVEKSLLALGVDASEDAIQQIIEFRANMDNGGQCSQLDDNPGLRLIELFAARSKREEITDGSSYADYNVFTMLELTGLSEDTDFNSTNDAFSAVPVDPGVKMLFKQDTGVYIPYWEDATGDVSDAMNSLAQFDPVNVVAGDGEIVFSEIICASELMSSDE